MGLAIANVTFQFSDIIVPVLETKIETKKDGWILTGTVTVTEKEVGEKRQERRLNFNEKTFWKIIFWEMFWRSSSKIYQAILIENAEIFVCICLDMYKIDITICILILTIVFFTTYKKFWFYS